MMYVGWVCMIDHFKGGHRAAWRAFCHCDSRRRARRKLAHYDNPNVVDFLVLYRGKHPTNAARVR